MVAQIFNGLRSAYKSKGDYDKAIDYYERSLKIRSAALLEHHPDVAKSDTGLGNTLILIRDYTRALKMLWKAFTIFIDTFGQDHAHTKGAQGVIVRAQKAKESTEIGQGCVVCVIV